MSLLSETKDIVGIRTYVKGEQYFHQGKVQHCEVTSAGAHNLHERPAKHGESVLRFMRGPDAGFTDSEGGRKIRMAKVRIKVSGRFRTGQCAEAWRRIPGHPGSMAAPGCNPLAAIRTAPAGNAADMIKTHRAQSSATKG